MKDRSAEEILRCTFAHLDKVLREKRQEKGEARAKTGGRHAQQWEESASPERVAGANVGDG